MNSHSAPARRIAIIPARGGSKRIPRKNIKSFLGRPVIAYPIQAALASQLFDEVMVSTDDQEIAESSLALGAKVPFLRSAENSNDLATTVAVLLEVLAAYQRQERNFETACCIYPANPFLTVQKIRAGLQELEQHKFDTVLSAIRYSSPVQRSFSLENGRMTMLFPEHLNTRSQDLSPVYHDAAQFYWFRPEVLRQQKKLWTPNTGVVEFSEMEVQDIDTAHDWDLAELKYRQWKK